MKDKNKSLKLESPQKFITIASNIPVIAEDNILVKFNYTMLCGSDYPKFNGTCPDAQCPLPIGMPIHECVGEVVLSNSKSFKIGDLVLSMPKNDAGLSDYFASYDYQSIKLLGWNKEDIKYAPLCQPAGTILNALDKVDDISNKRILLFGAGGIGYIFCNILKLRGASDITIIEPNNYRRNIAKNSFDIDVMTEWDSSLNNEFDLVIDAVGQDSQELIFNNSIDSAASEGVVLLFGIPTIKRQNINVYSLIRKNLKVIGVINPDWKKYLESGVDIVKSNLTSFKPMLTHEYSLQEAESAFKLFGDKDGERIKILLHNNVY